MIIGTTLGVIGLAITATAKSMPVAIMSVLISLKATSFR